MEKPKYSKANFITFIILFVGIFYLSYTMIKPYLLSMIMGAILALLCRPLYSRLKEGKKKKSKIASTAVVALLMLAVIGPLTVFVIYSVKEGVSIAQSLSGNENISFEALKEKLNELPAIQSLVGDTSSLEEELKNGIQSAAKGASGLFLGMVASVPQLLLQLVLTGLTCFFLLIDGPKFLQWSGSKIPLDGTIKGRLMKALSDTTISTIWATLAAASAQSAVMLFSFLILGVPAAFLASAATLIFSWIPMVGSSPVWIAGAIYLAIKGSTVKVILMVILGLITGVVDNIIRPLVLQGRGEMHPLVSLVAIFGGINLFGLLGVFIGPVIAAILISLVEISPEVLKHYEESQVNSKR